MINQIVLSFEDEPWQLSALEAIAAKNDRTSIDTVRLLVDRYLVDHIRKDKRKDIHGIDPWTDKVREFVSARDRVTMIDVLMWLDIDQQSQTQSIRNRIGKILRISGWAPVVGKVKLVSGGRKSQVFYVRTLSESPKIGG